MLSDKGAHAKQTWKFKLFMDSEHINLPSWATALATLVDKPVILILRDSRIIAGDFRSYDQFANVVLEGARERHVAGGQYADIPLGTMIIRGENIAMFGEVDEVLFDHRVRPSSLQSVFVMEDQERQVGAGNPVDLGFLDEQ